MQATHLPARDADPEGSGLVTSSLSQRTLLGALPSPAQQLFSSSLDLSKEMAWCTSAMCPQASNKPGRKMEGQEPSGEGMAIRIKPCALMTHSTCVLCVHHSVTRSVYVLFVYHAMTHSVCVCNVCIMLMTCCIEEDEVSLRVGHESGLQ